MIGIPCRERESENRYHNSIQALTCNRLSQNVLHPLVYCIPPIPLHKCFESKSMHFQGQT